ncbi:efflux transporter, RND family, MFP subunit [Acidovorax delafieldii 2AN]|jgi:RND family efflux transporter MFP subunit|uniref:Efflux transporter, RND family, MFP subunit n=1 Tax=Acidovorax delafieldii 2AN TaxID=573060 RepID=C5T9V8_ACIDE|nr:efflux RND transporter periplasmic adaptor subunit [Acidovorax delafieldii]EER58741.1 efflux transporter, RND family, MFP subunit [Acidovorax delafieldii 2AN]
MPQHPRAHAPTSPVFRTTLCAALLCACTSLSQAAGPAASPAAPASHPAIAWTAAQVQAAGVTTQTVGSSGAGAAAGVVLQGTVELPPQATELLSTPVAGVVQQVLVGAGQKVKAGEPVARLLSPDLLAWQRDLLQAQAQARLAASKLERDEKLHAEGIIAGLRLQETRTQNELAQVALRERRQALQMAGASTTGNTLQPGLTLRAAAAGTVLEVTATPGQRLDAGMPVAKLARGGQWAIALQATPSQAQSLRVGDLLTVQGCKAPARLAAIVPQVSPGNQAVQMRADFTAAEDCLRAQQFVQVTVAARTATAAPAANQVTVPAQAVVRHDGHAYVFVKTPQGFVPTAVVLGDDAAGQALVRSGVKAGDVIAVQGLAALKGAWQGMGGGAQ